MTENIEQLGEEWLEWAINHAGHLPITNNQLEDLQELIAKSQANEIEICKKYNIDSLNELTRIQYGDEAGDLVEKLEEEKASAIENIEQRTDEWYAARCGSLGASAIADALSKLKDGKTPGATSTNLRAKLVVERLTGVQEDGYKSGPMQHGIDNEDAARMAYEAHTGEFVTQVGLIRHPSIEGSHASPDGLVGDAGLVEIKCPNSSTHIETLKTGKISTKYIYQMQWQMVCTGRQWCDFVSYDPRLGNGLQLFVKRVERDNAKIAELEAGVIEFLEGVKSDVEALQAMARGEEAPEDDAA